MRRKKAQREVESLSKRTRKTIAPAKAQSGDIKKTVDWKKLITDSVIEMSKEQVKRVTDRAQQIFAAAQPLKSMGVPKANVMAMDKALQASCAAASMALDEQIVFAGGWAGGWGGYGAFAEGQAFLGYPYLSELSQRPEYRMIAETTATEMTRKWIKIEAASSKDGGVDKSEKVKQLEDELERLKVRDHLRKISEQDSFFGRAHLFMDFGASQGDEIKTPVGNGLNEITKQKVKVGSLKRLQTVEAVWCYPQGYNSTNPLDPTWYKPEIWFAMGQQVHASRLLTFVGREVPDLLKPAYSFGGLAMSQMAKPYVDNWLRTRQSVSDLLHSFTVWNLSSNLAETLTPGGEGLAARITLFNNLRDNKGLMLTDKETEELDNISASLSTLDALQGQAQEQMCSVAHTPKVKLLGLDPAGLNASAEGEMRSYYDYIHALQPKFYGENLNVIFRMAQINLWGQVDPDLSYSWVDLWSLSVKEQAEVRKTDAETGVILIDGGVIDAGEERQRIASDEGSPYHSLDTDKIIIPPESGEQTGFEQDLDLSKETPNAV